MTAWEDRFRAPRVSLPEWAEDAPDRCFYSSNATGTFELYTWDRGTGATAQATSRPNGTTDGLLSPDGEQLWWFDDHDGDEFGIWRKQPFAGGDAVVAAPGVHAGYSAGCEVGRGLSVVGVSTDDGSTLYVVRPDGTSVLYASKDDADVAALSRDDRLVLIEHSEHGDSRHRALRVLTVDGAVVGDLWDGEGLGLHGIEFSPDGSTVLALHEKGGRPEPLLWHLDSGEVDRLAVDLPGDLTAEYVVDGSALLVVSEARGRATLHRVGFDGTVEDLGPGEGCVVDATPRPDGSVEYRWSSSAAPAVIRSTSGLPVLEAPGPLAPPSVPVTDVFVDGPGGPVHALVATPAGEGPFPTVFLVHGGPQWHDSDSFAADRAAFVDLGCAVVHVNYRGSTGYGAAWRDAIEGRPGLTELEDVAAVRDWAVSSGLASQCVLAGGSWGGYLTLLGLGTQPELWDLGSAAVPVADYVAAYEDEMEPLRAFDRSLFGGSPLDLPELYERCSPLTYVEHVRVPVLILAGANDPRCPIRQIDNWVQAATELGKDVEVYRFDAGHGSLVVEERIRQMRAELEFVGRHLGLTVPS
ncbi:prolyl oligopeptidase family serine peptidase [Streptomyces sp.]|uniref:prolyl oligopeptidase family serine peptidase n=1 Tax=Streptomyces sp. TaxID=1931 RepID=UPI0025D2D0F6|nr:prolyl oligopeptidase family serine peptidase [Streptomyces sp.]